MPSARTSRACVNPVMRVTAAPMPGSEQGGLILWRIY